MGGPAAAVAGPVRRARSAIAEAGWARWEWVVLGVAVVLPFVRSVLRWGAGWVPIGDNANIAIRAQDLGTSITPLVGMPSGLGTYSSIPTTHPGPLVFWVIGPWVRVLGLHPLPVLLGVAAVAAASSAVLLVQARRLAGRSGFVAGALILTTVVALIPYSMVQPLNPAMAVLPAMAALVAAAAVVAGDDRSLPTVVLTASFAAQAELSYTTLMVAVGALAAGASGRRRWRSGPGPELRRAWLWSLAALGVCWVGPVVDVVTNGGGNVTATLQGVSGSEVVTQGPAAARDTVLALVNGSGWFRWIGSSPLPTAPLGTLVSVVALVVTHREGLRRRPRPARALLAVAVLAAVVTSLSQMATPEAAGRQADYLLPVVVTGAIVWFSALAWAVAAVAATVRAPRPRTALVTLAVVICVGTLTLRTVMVDTLEPGSGAVAPLASQVEAELRPQKLLLVPAGGPTSQSVLRGVGLVLEADGFAILYPPDQVDYVSRGRVGTYGRRLAITRDLVGDAPDGWREVARWRPPDIDPDELDGLRSEVARAVRAAGPELTHQASAFQIGQIVAAFTDSGVDLLDDAAVIALGQRYVDDPASLADLPDDALAGMVEERTIRGDAVDQGRLSRFTTLTDEDEVVLWLVPSL